MPVLVLVVFDGDHVVLDFEEAIGVGSVGDLVKQERLGSKGRGVGIEGDVVT